MSDPYFQAIQEQWPTIRALYMTYGSKKPIILYDIQENRIYAYPYKEFKAEMSKNSQALLEHDYKSASVLGSMVVFVRDNIERKLVSYVMSIDTNDHSMTREGPSGKPQHQPYSVKIESSLSGGQPVHRQVTRHKD